MNNTDRIHARYDADNDMRPDGPPVTWAEEQLAQLIDRMKARIDALEQRIQALETAAELARWKASGRP